MRGAERATKQSQNMRTTININDQLLKKVTQLTGIREKTSLVQMGLEALITKENSRRLALLGGSQKSLKAIPRRKQRDFANSVTRVRKSLKSH